MVKKLVTRKDFAEMAGVTPAAVTKAANNALKHCVDGKLIDSAHPDALAYIEKIARAKTPETLPGIDPLYEDAVNVCRELEKWNAHTVAKNLGIGHRRATEIMKQIDAAGVREAEARAAKVMATPKKEPHVRGTAAAKQKRADEDTDPLTDDPLIPPNIEIYADMTLRDIYEQFGTAPRFRDWLSSMKDIVAIQEKQLKAEQVKGTLVSRDIVHRFIVDPIDSAHIKLLRDGSQTISVRAVALCEAGATPAEIKKLVEDTISSFIKPMKAKVSRAMENLKTDMSEDDIDV